MTHDLDDVVAQTLGKRPAPAARTATADARIDRLVGEVFSREVELPEEFGALSPKQVGRVEHFAATHRMTPEAAHAMFRGRTRARAADTARQATANAVVAATQGGALR